MKNEKLSNEQWLEKRSNLHLELLNMYKDLMQYCIKIDIDIFAAYGTFLGAVRHKGFIPWDDDLDVFIKQEDVVKLFNNSSLLSDKYSIQSFENNPKYPYTTIKLVNTEIKTTKTNKTLKGVPDGLLLDIFIIHPTNKTSRRQPLVYDQIYWKNSKHQGEGMISFFKNLYSKLHFFIPRKNMLKRYRKFIDKNIEVDGERFFSNSLNDNNAYSYTEYFDVVKYKFEDTYILGPKDYEKVLSELYGPDWRKPPKDIYKTIGDIDLK